jgi:hypothetical protein
MKNKFLKMRRFYQGIGRVWCLVLKDYIEFNKSGFRHLIRKNGILRPYREQRRRFAALTYAKEIIETAQEYFFFEETMKQGIRARFWSLVAMRSDFLVTVVIRQLGDGKKHFFSVYAKKNPRGRAWIFDPSVSTFVWPLRVTPFFVDQGIACAEPSRT